MKKQRSRTWIKLPTMTAEQHHQRHAELHHALDELIADYFAWEFETRPQNSKLGATTITELMHWSNEQQKAAPPWIPRGREHAHGRRIQRSRQPAAIQLDDRDY
jgi:hypothetical protein